MNERIEKFIDDAKLTAVCEMFEDELVEFAELIIKECIGVLEETNLIDDDPVVNIKEHFGVK